MLLGKAITYFRQQINAHLGVVYFSRSSVLQTTFTALEVENTKQIKCSICLCFDGRSVHEEQFITDIKFQPTQLWFAPLRFDYVCAGTPYLSNYIVLYVLILDYNILRTTISHLLVVKIVFLIVS